MRQHRSLGTPGGAGSVTINSDIGLSLRIDFCVEPRIIERALTQDRCERRELRSVIVPEPAIIDVIDCPQPDRLTRHRQHLVDLFLILPYQNHGTGMAEQKSQFIDRGVRIGTHDARADRECGDLQHELLFAILRDKGDYFAALQAGGRQSSRITACALVDLTPVKRSPYPSTLAADRSPRAAVACPVAQQLRQGTAA